MDLHLISLREYLDGAERAMQDAPILWARRSPARVFDAKGVMSRYLGTREPNFPRAAA